MLPPRAYVDEAVADWEAEHLFLGGWVCVGHVEPLSERGRFLTRQIKDESLLFVGDDEGVPHGFFNVCRHRGARLVEEDEGTMRRLQCPYHAWSYGFDGSLRNAPHTEEIEDFDPATFGLTPLRTAIVGGLLFCDVSGTRRRSRSTSARSPSSSSTGASATLRARRRSPTTSTPTGRRSSRTTPSACTAPACTPSSTASQPLPQRRGLRGPRRLVRRLDDRSARAPRRWPPTAAAPRARRSPG